MNLAESEGSLVEGIVVSDVSLSIHKSVILRNVCAEFPDGEITGIIGNNGSGKSMLLKCICGFIVPSQGTITVHGVNYHEKKRFPKSIGFVIESPGFLGELSGRENLLQLSQIQNKIKPQSVNEVLKTVGLDPLDYKPVRKYSMGMKQRLGIAQAIMEDPDTLILDEPMNGLDKQGVADMRYLFAEIGKRRKTMILTSHIQEDIDFLCKRVYQMDGGILQRVR